MLYKVKENPQNSQKEKKKLHSETKDSIFVGKKLYRNSPRAEQCSQGKWFVVFHHASRSCILIS